LTVIAAINITVRFQLRMGSGSYGGVRTESTGSGERNPKACVVNLDKTWGYLGGHCVRIFVFIKQQYTYKPLRFDYTYAFECQMLLHTGWQQDGASAKEWWPHLQRVTLNTWYRARELLNTQWLIYSQLSLSFATAGSVIK